MAILEDQGFLDRFVAVRSDLPSLRHIITIDAPAVGPTASSRGRT